MISSSEIAGILERTDFPKSRSEIIKIAKDKKASNEIINVLNTLPNKQYNSLAGIWDAIGEVE
ncbi:TPA: hypothetical protein DDW69_02115 [candidate division CPR2 bacterium]|uniref:DUF2795 domain-containing protein n=1 Tax=candidate division CPR2 bacterium GW2011_GWC1_41_48 TaxID=1618344 RepID=A0A0G0YJV6_UNCC2|nr:MAG: hypothetical protein UT47_C0001G0226 [candidate division CPR2 bacterium GW2011_GWC2_39_35]KKR28121.1 MAG: hypothetical protein UT60_C0027G0011 [candidate division CPR2 bacterium GW2011_GWD2_39_7]KKR29554.1 MAG: hypothetical protein UT59_C0005G0009 [candidate division CPR2 bacterium GW2011_GWD1_39_7]KKS09821.1 MAG: hypothetical protein UU65_C0001G0226 [candidate division CPR2 bacterium GW2011_GWC1_41_48]OGB55860.1 MAG: hypothetical protein A2Y27_00360 [candidate division CPR2 bacterium G